jgi:Protein of unknown function (DUF1360)
MSLLIIALVVLAVYRVSHMVALEDGPFEAFFWWREFLTKKFGLNHWITKGFNCPLCISFWVSLIGAIIIYRGNLVYFFVYWLAIAGAVMVLHLLVYRR